MSPAERLALDNADLKPHHIDNLVETMRGLNMTMVRIADQNARDAEHRLFAREREHRLISLLEQIATNTAGIPALVESIAKRLG